MKPDYQDSNLQRVIDINMLPRAFNSFKVISRGAKGVPTEMEFYRGDFRSVNNRKHVMTMYLEVDVQGNVDGAYTEVIES